MWNAIILVQDLTSSRRANSYDDNYYTTGISTLIPKEVIQILWNLHLDND